MTRRLTISVIIPTFNEERYIASCIQALLAQSKVPDEIIVVDNNSVDRTVSIARSYPDVRIIREQQQGLYYARQAGMAAATGDVLCRIDADTIVQPGWIEAIVDQFTDDTVMALTGPVGYHDFPGSRITLWGQHWMLKGALALDYHFMFGCNMAVRRSAWRRVNGELCNKSCLLEDIDIALHLREANLLPSYSERMVAYVSCRRALDPLPDFFRYIGKHVGTLRAHGQPVFAGYYSQFLYMVFYVLFRPFVRMYDVDARKFRITLLWHEAEYRPDPMTTGEPAGASGELPVRSID